MKALEAVIASGIDPSRILPGTGCASNKEAIDLTRHSLEVGCKNVLVMPPFFFKSLTDANVVSAIVS